MNDARDPLLESLFEQAERQLIDEEFTAEVMARLTKRGRIVLLARVAVVSLLIAVELLLNAPLQNSVGALTEIMSTSLVQLQNEWLAVAVAPLNSIAGLIGVLLVGMQFLIRRAVR